KGSRSRSPSWAGLVVLLICIVGTDDRLVLPQSRLLQLLHRHAILQALTDELLSEALPGRWWFLELAVEGLPTIADGKSELEVLPAGAASLDQERGYPLVP